MVVVIAYNYCSMVGEEEKSCCHRRKQKLSVLGKKKEMPQILLTRSAIAVGEKRLSSRDAAREEKVATAIGGHGRAVIDAKGLLLVAGGEGWVVDHGCRERCHIVLRGRGDDWVAVGLKPWLAAG